MSGLCPCGLSGCSDAGRSVVGTVHPARTVDCPTEGVAAYVDDGECSACGSVVQTEAKYDALVESVRALADDWEQFAGTNSRAAEVYGPQKVSVTHAVKTIRALLPPTPADETEGGDRDE